MSRFAKLKEISKAPREDKNLVEIELCGAKIQTTVTDKEKWDLHIKLIMIDRMISEYFRDKNEDDLESRDSDELDILKDIQEILGEK